MNSRKSRRRSATRPRRQALPRLDAERVAVFRRRLLAWYRRRGRDLPWRQTRDPYAILVSEVMLQQTQVRRVLDFFPRFLARYPTVGELAAASEEAVRQAWEGLGYYRRATNLRAAARIVAQRHGGRLPTDPAALERLPGVGRYTAGAVASFAFGADTPIVDTNAGRVLTRVFGAGPVRGRTRRLWGIACRVTPTGRAYAFNQGIMDLGAMICTARRPSCARCPVRTVCRTFASRARTADQR